MTILKGETITEPTTNNDPYTFDKWILSDGQAFDFSNPVDQDMTLTATWIAPAVVSFVHHPESDIKDEQDFQMDVKLGETVSNPGTPTSDGATFTGWYLTPEYVEGETPFSWSTEPITEDITLYAHWTVKIQGADMTYATSTIYSVEVPICTTYGELTGLPTESNGHAITRWCLAPDGEQVPDDYSFEAGTVLYAAFD